MFKQVALSLNKQVYFNIKNFSFEDQKIKLQVQISKHNVSIDSYIYNVSCQPLCYFELVTNYMGKKADQVITTNTVRNTGKLVMYTCLL